MTYPKAGDLRILVYWYRRADGEETYRWADDEETYRRADGEKSYRRAAVLKHICKSVQV